MAQIYSELIWLTLEPQIKVGGSDCKTENSFAENEGKTFEFFRHRKFHSNFQKKNENSILLILVI